MLATASVSDGLIWVWKIGTPEAILVIPEAADNCTLEAVAFHPNGKYLAVGGLDWLATSGADGALCVWDLETRDKLLTLEAGVTAIGIRRDRPLPRGGDVQPDRPVGRGLGLREAGEGLRPAGPPRPDQRGGVLPGRELAGVRRGRLTVRVWNVLTGRLAVARQFDAAVQSLAFSPDGQYLFTGNGNTTAYRLEMKKMLED